MASRAPEDKYTKIKLLGEGSFGKAFLVKINSTGEQAVIKEIDLTKMPEAEKREAFKEAKILETLNHPSIVKFKEVYKTKRGILCIVMDYADGGDLLQKIKMQRGRYFSEGQVLDWFTQISLALKHVHDRKILHRDLKTQNIFLTSKNTAKLGDFGIAKVLSNTKEKAKTVVGTPYYISPEIIQNRAYSFESDIWSLGVVLYELCALKPPFDATSLSALAMKIVRGSCNPIPAQFSKELKSMVSQLMSVDTLKRPNINQILRSPLITSRIPNFLSNTVQSIEFSHTILHKRNAFDPKNKLVEIAGGMAKKPDVEAPRVAPPPRPEPQRPAPQPESKKVNYHYQQQQAKAAKEDKDKKIQEYYERLREQEKQKPPRPGMGIPKGDLYVGKKPNPSPQPIPPPEYKPRHPSADPAIQKRREELHHREERHQIVQHHREEHHHREEQRHQIVQQHKEIPYHREERHYAPPPKPHQEIRHQKPPIQHDIFDNRPKPAPVIKPKPEVKKPAPNFIVHNYEPYKYEEEVAKDYPRAQVVHVDNRRPVSANQPKKKLEALKEIERRKEKEKEQNIIAAKEKEKNEEERKERKKKMEEERKKMREDIEKKRRNSRKSMPEVELVQKDYSKDIPRKKWEDAEKQPPSQKPHNEPPRKQWADVEKNSQHKKNEPPRKQWEEVEKQPPPVPRPAPNNIEEIKEVDEPESTAKFLEPILPEEKKEERIPPPLAFDSKSIKMQVDVLTHTIISKKKGKLKEEEKLEKDMNQLMEELKSLMDQHETEESKEEKPVAQTTETTEEEDREDIPDPEGEAVPTTENEGVSQFENIESILCYLESEFGFEMFVKVYQIIRKVDDEQQGEVDLGVYEKALEGIMNLNQIQRSLFLFLVLKRLEEQAIEITE